VNVTVSGYVLDISDIDETNQDFTVSLYLRHEWKDPRLEFTEIEAGTDKLALNQEFIKKIWIPDSFIVNERESRAHNLIMDNQFVRILTDGMVLISTKLSIKASCNLQLGWFPFDRHTCPLLIESYGYNMDDYTYTWKMNDKGSTKSAVGVSRETTSIKFSVAAVNTRQETEQLGQKSYSRLAVEFFFIRASTRFVHEIYMPAIILTFLSFITLLHATGSPTQRLQLSVLVVGLMIVLMALSARTIPPVGYQTALDFYLLACLLTISCVVIVNVAISLILSSSNDTNGIVRLRSENTNTNVEDDGKEVLFETGPRFSSKTSRILTLFVKLRFIIPLVFAVFNLLYWMIVLIGSSFYPEDFLILENFGNN